MSTSSTPHSRASIPCGIAAGRVPGVLSSTHFTSLYCGPPARIATRNHPRQRDERRSAQRSPLTCCAPLPPAASEPPRSVRHAVQLREGAAVPLSHAQSCMQPSRRHQDAHAKQRRRRRRKRVPARPRPVAGAVSPRDATRHLQVPPALAPPYSPPPLPSPPSCASVLVLNMGRGEPSPGADVAGVSPVQVQMWQG